MCLIVCFTALLGTVSLFCHEAESAVTAFGSLKPSNPSFVKERDNITLKWNYTIDGSIGFAKFSNVTDGSSTLIASKFGAGDVNVVASFQETFTVDISNTLSQVTILTVQRSDHGSYELEIVTIANVVLRDTVELIVQFESKLTSYSGDQTDSEGSNLTLHCDATGKPTPNITWTRVWENGTNGEDVFFGNPWNIVNISRTAAGRYRCTAYNRIGNPVSHSLYVNVTYKPDTVTLVSNTTENKDCSDLWVNFTCISSEANPPAYNYLLSDDEDGSSFSKSGTWIKKISRGGKSIYNCLAYQLVGNVTSTNDITLTVNVPLAMEQAENKTVQEGDNVELSCSVTGIPDPTVIWTKVQDGGYNATKGKLLNITNITRAQAGEYRCTANNTCGEESTVANIDVQYQPENVILTTNTTSKVCTGVVTNFTCTAEANPAVHTYLLYENGTVIENVGISGTWIKTMENAGQFVFRCEANNSVQGIGKSGDTILTVDVPASVEQAENKVVKEGDNVEVYCRVTAGIPDPTVLWTKVVTGEHIKGNPLNITNITRAQDGEYRCTANNSCGVDFTVVDIDVQHKPDDVRLTKNTTNSVCEGIIINFTCSAEANPAVHTYLLYENGTVIYNMGLGTVIKTMENAGQFVFRCEANNSVQGTGRSSDTILTVHAPAVIVKQAEHKIIEEGADVELYCNVTGIPDPTVIWKKVKTGEIIEGNVLNITNITRAQAGEYRCTANNTCGEASTMANIDVQYPPTVTREGHIIDVTDGDPASISCAVRGNPQPNITWYKGNDTSSGTMINTNSNLEFPETVLNDSGWYTCFAENALGNVTVTVQLRVAKLVPSTPSTSSKPTTKESTIYASATIDKSCDERLEVEKRFPSLACERVRHLGCLSAQAVDSRCGSVIVDFKMKFNQSAVVSEVLNVLKTAAKEDNFDGFKVDPNSIEQLSPPPTDTSGTKKAICSGFFKKEDCSMNWVPLAIIAVVGVTVICVIVVVIGCWVHKRR